MNREGIPGARPQGEHFAKVDTTQWRVIPLQAKGYRDAQATPGDHLVMSLPVNRSTAG